jgi:very-short-patch-repair endonuclease
MAALLACGRRAVLSHWTAAAISGMIRPTADGPVDVTGPRGLRGPRAGVRLHRSGRLHPDEVELRDGLRLTTPTRTLIDLASCLGPRDVEHVLARAERRQLVTPDALEADLARHARRSGVRLLRTLLEASGGPALTRSEAEMRFLDLVRKSGMPRPRSNSIVGGLEVDFVWPSRRLVVEIDGFAHHRGRWAFERDRSRDCALTAAGFRVMRFTWRRLTLRSETVLAELAQALAHGVSERTPSRDPTASRLRREPSRFARGTVS